MKILLSKLLTRNGKEGEKKVFDVCLKRGLCSYTFLSSGPPTGVSNTQKHYNSTAHYFDVRNCSKVSCDSATSNSSGHGVNCQS
mmetsp:Transcript_14977/g.24374  ORF Transcript_14977/g.24374 Transcript_14977/m.24374 type:complete len:84 (+) Transcript_14977:305-556(+)